MNQRDALYYIMTGETFDGRKAAEMGLVNEAVPRASCASARALAKVLLDKNPTVLRAAKHACAGRWTCRGTTPTIISFAKIDQMRFLDPEKGREQGHVAIPRR